LYKPITDSSDKTGENLGVIGDVARYSDTYRILKRRYAGPGLSQSLEKNFAKNNPQIISKYFSNLDELPDEVLTALCAN
jgi:hypothetical protein